MILYLFRAVVANRTKGLKPQIKLFQSKILPNYFDLPARTETDRRGYDFWFRRKPCPTAEVAKYSKYAARSALRLGVCVLHWVGMGLHCHTVLPLLT